MLRKLNDDARAIGEGLLTRAQVVGQFTVKGAQHVASGGAACMLPAFLISPMDWDWAGTQILSRYLTGGGRTWTIKDDPMWTTYMAKSGLIEQVSPLLAVAIAQKMDKARVGDVVTVGPQQFHADIDNGEGIVGYQYLHGSNVAVGDCDLSASFSVEGIDSNRTQAQLNATLRLRWNDVIDPNPSYSTDTWKSIYAETCTAGLAQSYEIHIEWPESHNYIWLFRIKQLHLSDAR
jgi:hypothetical protein